jgi:hypothetical protein
MSRVKGRRTGWRNKRRKRGERTEWEKYKRTKRWAYGVVDDGLEGGSTEVGEHHLRGGVESALLMVMVMMVMMMMMMVIMKMMMMKMKMKMMMMKLAKEYLKL